MGAFIQEKYRDITYFRGIDFHQDIVDHPESADFITVYVYLHDVDSNQSPLFVIKNSHVFGADTFPHEISLEGRSNEVSYTHRDGRNIRLPLTELTGMGGSMYIWSAYTLHGTQPESSNSPRISLRYLIKANKNRRSKVFIDDYLDSIDGERFLKIAREDLDHSGKSLNMGNVINIKK